jgi:calcium-dependent protein kinase
MAPEVLRGNYTKEADLWSIGVIVFMLLSSQMPFYGRARKHIIEQILAGKYQFKGRRWKTISTQAKAFVGDLLVVDADERASAEEALSMSWLNRRFTATVRNANVAEEKLVLQSLLRFATYTKLKRMALMVIAHKSSSEEIGILRKVFQKYDSKRAGYLTITEFATAVSAAGLPESKVQQVFDAVVRAIVLRREYF